MRDLFPGYYRPSSANFEKLWTEAIFVFDTNVLLDFYSYPETIRDVFFSVLSKLGGRIWIPYQVGLEFHRNRFSRIKQANGRVEKLLQTIKNTGEQLSSEVNTIELEKRNIGISNIQERLSAVKVAHTALSEAVERACDKLPPVSLEDPIGEQICQLFEGRVGDPPTSQDELDKCLADGQERFDKKIPPGFADAQKGDDTYRDRGITYFRKFGDLLLWRQLLSHAAKTPGSSVVLVTGDKKDDWWWKEDGKTLGPLPQLVQEIKSSAQVDLFWMYSADQFLEHAETHLKATEVTPEAVEQVKESLAAARMEPVISSIRNALTDPDVRSEYEALVKNFIEQAGETRIDNFPEVLLTSSFVNVAEDAVYNWLKTIHPVPITRTKNFPDFIVDKGGVLSGYEVKSLRNLSPRAFPPSVVNALLRGYLEVNEGRIDDFTLVLSFTSHDGVPITDDNWRNEMLRRGRHLLEKYPAQAIILGVTSDDAFSPKLVITR